MKKVTVGATRTTTTYLRDASGNVMAIYEEKTDQRLAVKEIPIYGSSRLGQYRPKTDTKKTALGQRIYEFSNHLGNVLVTLTDNKVPQTDGTYESVVVSASDYYPFGMIMSERGYQNTEYRFGFQGQEYDEETGTDHYTYRQADRIIGRFWSLDPLSAKYPHNSPYAFSENRVIDGVELEGMEYLSVHDESFNRGKPARPAFNYDNGFLQDWPEIGYVAKPYEPGGSEYLDYAWWSVYSYGATLLRWDLGNALSGYRHFRGATGKDYNFDLEDYFDDDKSGKIMLYNATEIAKENASQLITTPGEKIEMTSKGFSVTGGSKLFPYPDTEDWQKAVGAFNFWMSATVSSSSDGSGTTTYVMNLTIHAEDKYNFNPGAKDIASDIPDSDNGVFELTGLGKEFMQYGTYTETIIWKKKTTTLNPSDSSPTKLRSPDNSSPKPREN